MRFSPNGRTGYLTGTEVTAVNLTTGAVSWTANLPVMWIPENQTTISPDGKTLYAPAYDSRTRTVSIYRIPAATGIPRLAPIQLGRVTFDLELNLSADGKTLYIQSQSLPAINKTWMRPFDAATGTPGRLIRISWTGSVLFGPK
jgi:sugar lactone lactonase YvrE